MIVDLMRNDLGRVCEIGHRPGRVAARRSSRTPGVWHLVSTVAAGCARMSTTRSCCAATFPPGSVTGAPKLRALDAIARARAQSARGRTPARSASPAPSWGLEFAVAIRTFEIARRPHRARRRRRRDRRQRADAGMARMPAQGGAVARGGRARAGARSCVTPVARADDAQLAGGLLETVLVIDGAPVRLADHLARLDRSCRELYGRGDPDRRRRPGRAAARGAGAGRGRCCASCDDARRHVARSAAGALHEATPRVTWRECARARRPVAAQVGRPRLPLGGRRAAARPHRCSSPTTAPVLETSRGNVFLLCADGSLAHAAASRRPAARGHPPRGARSRSRSAGGTPTLRRSPSTELREHACVLDEQPQRRSRRSPRSTASALPRRDERRWRTASAPGCPWIRGGGATDSLGRLTIMTSGDEIHDLGARGAASPVPAAAHPASSATSASTCRSRSPSSRRWTPCSSPAR